MPRAVTRDRSVLWVQGSTAFQPVRRPMPPKVAAAKTAIDAFILQKLAERQLGMSPEADARARPA